MVTLIALLFLSSCTTYEPSLKIEILEIDYSKVNFELNILESKEHGIIESIDLIKDGIIVQSKGDLDREFDELLSNTEYQIQVIYSYQIRPQQEAQTITETISFRTESFEVPELAVITEELSYQTANLELIMIDNYNLISIENILLINEINETINIELSDIANLDNLFSNHNYSLLIEYSFDLNDGTGVKIQNYTFEFKTQEYKVPELRINLNETSYHSANIDIEFLNHNLKGKIIDIYLNPGSTITNDFNNLSDINIDNLWSNHLYEVNVLFQYDLADGNGMILDSTLLLFETKAYNKPTATIKLTNISNYAISFELDINDNDELGWIEEIKVLNSNDEIIISQSSFVDLVDNLIPNKSYQLVLVYQYDLQDGEGLKEIVHNIDFKTPLFDGHGTLISPYLIRSSMDFQNMGQYQSAEHSYFQLIADIDFLGLDFEPIDNFYHNLDGKGHIIKNVVISENIVDKELNLGLFRNNQGVISNLNIENIEIIASSIFNSNVGILVGLNYGDISNIRIQGKIINSSENSSNTGGLIGKQVSGKLNEIYVRVVLESTGVFGSYVGGIAGFVEPQGKIDIANIYSDSVIISRSPQYSSAGGLFGIIVAVGSNEVFINNMKALGSVITSSNSRNFGGGITGKVYPNNGGSISIENALIQVNIEGTFTDWEAYFGGSIGFILATYNAKFILQNSLSLGDVTMLGDNHFSGVGNVYGHLNSFGAQSALINIFGEQKQALIQNGITPETRADIENSSIQIINLLEYEQNDLYFNILKFNEEIWFSDNENNVPKLYFE
jgi:hypothetical protein